MSDAFLCLLSAIPDETDPQTLKQPLWLPAIVGELDYTEEAGHNEYTTVRRGQFSQPEGGRGVRTAKRLMQASLDVYTSWAPLGFMPEIPQDLDPDEIRAQLFDILRARRAFKIKVWRRGFPTAEISMAATLRSVQPAIKEGEAAARYFTLEVREWRDPTVDRRTSSKSRKSGVNLPTTFRLASTDTTTTLNSLSQQFYGTTSLWRAIAEANGITRWGNATPLRGYYASVFKAVPGSEAAVLRIPMRPTTGAPALVVGVSQQPTTGSTRARA